MNTQDILTLYRYNAWSNGKILEMAGRVTPEQFVAAVPFPHGSLRGTLVHIVYGEWVWCNRWEGTPRNPVWKAQDFPTFEALRTRWEAEDARLMKFAGQVTDEKLYSRFKYVATEGEPHERALWEAMMHVVDHGIQHKTEAAAILTGMGHSPGDLDLIVYLNEKG
jgi:uncharacterized damage-inducible protein DinB